MKHGLKKGIYILPNLFTTANLFCGFASIVTSIKVTLNHSDDYRFCAVLLFLGAIFDLVDGRVAKVTNTASRFGEEYDSLADVVSFGVAPAILVFLWGLQDLGRVGWLGAFLFVACGALRLARYNIQSKNVERNYYEGLSIPMAGLMLASSVLIWDGAPGNQDFIYIQNDVRGFILGLTYLLALLMVSNIPYRSHKTLSLQRRLPFYYMFFVVMLVTFIALKPWWVLYGLGCIYLLSGPVERFVFGRKLEELCIPQVKKKHTKSTGKADLIHLKEKRE